MQHHGSRLEFYLHECRNDVSMGIFHSRPPPPYRSRTGLPPSALDDYDSDSEEEFVDEADEDSNGN